MRQAYTKKAFKPETLKVIRQADAIITDFQNQGYRMTLRQLYYQFVSRNLITNEEKSYKKLASTVSEGRLAGYLDWDGIEDRGRVAARPSHYDGLDHMMRVLQNAADGYTLDKWLEQNYYVELWVEKQALAGVLEPLAEKHHVTLMVNKGYSSQSAMYAAAQRFREGMGTDGDRIEFDPDFHECKESEFGNGWHMLESKRDGLLLYLGDHDPSGEDMVRDIRERLTMFGVDAAAFTVKKVALTTAQVREHNPPPNPAKMTDPRADAYVRKHGQSSWEVDALDPPVLVQLIEEAITAVVDAKALKDVTAREAREQGEIRRALKNIRFDQPSQKK